MLEGGHICPLLLPEAEDSRQIPFLLQELLVPPNQEKLPLCPVPPLVGVVGLDRASVYSPVQSCGGGLTKARSSINQRSLLPIQCQYESLVWGAVSGERLFSAYSSIMECKAAEWHWRGSSGPLLQLQPGKYYL